MLRTLLLLSLFASCMSANSRPGGFPSSSARPIVCRNHASQPDPQRACAHRSSFNFGTSLTRQSAPRRGFVFARSARRSDFSFFSRTFCSFFSVVLVFILRACPCPFSLSRAANNKSQQDEGLGAGSSVDAVAHSLRRRVCHPKKQRHQSGSTISAGCAKISPKKQQHCRTTTRGVVVRKGTGGCHCC